MEKIARFKLKEDYDFSSLKISAPATWINKDAIKCVHYNLADDVTLNIGFPEDLSEWDDFSYILVLDENFCQPYTPFYVAWCGEVKNLFRFLDLIIHNYNKKMRELPWLEEIND